MIMDEDMEQLDLSLAVTSHYVSLSPASFTISSKHISFKCTGNTDYTAGKSGSSTTAQLGYITFIHSYQQPPLHYLLCGGWHHVENKNSPAKLILIYLQFTDEKIETVRV